MTIKPLGALSAEEFAKLTVPAHEFILEPVLRQSCFDLAAARGWTASQISELRAQRDREYPSTGKRSGRGAKLLYDRETRPRVWAQVVPYDPNLPIRGRYLSLQLVVEPRGMSQTGSAIGWWPTPLPVTLQIEGKRLIAEVRPPARGFNAADLHMEYRPTENLAVLEETVAFFIPEHSSDPSRRPRDEQLWAEVTIPRQGPPRPIRLGVRKGGGSIVPLQLE